MDGHECSNRHLAERFFEKEKIDIKKISVIKERGYWRYLYLVNGSPVSMIIFACPLCGRKLE